MEQCYVRTLLPLLLSRTATCSFRSIASVEFRQPKQKAYYDQRFEKIYKFIYNDKFDAILQNLAVGIRQPYHLTSTHIIYYQSQAYNGLKIKIRVYLIT